MKLLRFIVLLVGVSIPLSSIALEIGGGSFMSIGFMASILYFVCIIPFLTKGFNLTKTYGKTLTMPLLFLLILTISNFLYSCEAPDIPVFSNSIFLCYVLMCLLLIHSMIDKDATQFCLWGFSLGCCFVSVVFWIINGISVLDERTTFLDENANELGIFMSIGLMIIYNDFILHDKLQWGVFRFLFIIPCILLISVLLGTASRTAFIILVLFAVLCVLFYPAKNKIAKGIVLLIGTIIIIAGFAYMLNNADNFLIVSRLFEAKDDNLSGRSSIWQALLPHIMDHPIIGVGQTGYVRVANDVLNHTKTIGNITYGFSPHNVIIEVALYTGLIGLTCWIIFWSGIFKKSILCYKYTRNFMPILLLLPIIASILSGQILASKWGYMLYAYILSTYMQVQQDELKPSI